MNVKKTLCLYIESLLRTNEDLEQRLEAASAALARTQGQRDVAEGSLAKTHQQLDAAEEQLSAAEASLAQAKAEIERLSTEGVHDLDETELTGKNE